VDVVFPDGTALRACGLAQRDDNRIWRTFGLYLDNRWQPDWPAEVIDWADFGLPRAPEDAARAIRDAFDRARAESTSKSAASVGSVAPAPSSRAWRRWPACPRSMPSAGCALITELKQLKRRSRRHGFTGSPRTRRSVNRLKRIGGTGLGVDNGSGDVRRVVELGSVRE